MNGSASARPTNPSDSGSFVSAYTCQATTVAWICVPIVSATRLATYQRKLVFRSDMYGSCRSGVPRARVRTPDDTDASNGGQFSGCGAFHCRIFYFVRDPRGDFVTVATVNRPVEGEYLPYYEKYIALVPDGDVVSLLEEQMVE